MSNNRSIYIASSAVILLMMFFLSHCIDSTNKAAKRVSYYLELEDRSQNDYASTWFPQIKNEIYGKQYAITQRSESEWPFYQTYPKSHRIPMDSLITPHVISHYFDDRSVEKAKEGEFLVKVIFLDPIPEHNFDLIIYKKIDKNWEKMVDTGNHKITALHTKKGLNPIEAASRIIIRYSFK